MDTTGFHRTYLLRISTVRKVRVSSEQKGRHEHDHLERTQLKVHSSPWIPSIHRACAISAVAMRKARLPIGAQEGAIVQNFTTGRHDCYQPGERSAIITINTKTIIHRTYRLGMYTVRKVRLRSAKKRKGRHNHQLLKKRQWKVRSLSWIAGNTHRACPIISVIAIGKARLQSGEAQLSRSSTGKVQPLYSRREHPYTVPLLYRRGSMQLKKGISLTIRRCYTRQQL